MGGNGSGTGFRYGSKETTESRKRIDIRWLRKNGYLQPGKTGTLSWSVGGKQAGYICYQMKDGSMILDYRYRVNGGEWEPVEQEVFFDHTSCNYGGQRKWFLCPHCGKRVALLYAAGKYFLCRHCYNLTYASQLEDKAERLRRRSCKLRKRLGVSDNLFEPILFKPKNMHQKTFDRLRHEADYNSNLSLITGTRRLGIEI